MALGTLIEAAKILGHPSSRAISYAVQIGKIPHVKVGRTRCVELDGLAELWDQIKDPRGSKPGRRLKDPAGIIPKPALPSVKEHTSEATESNDGLNSLVVSQKAKQHWEAENARLKYEEKAATLIRVDVVEKVMFAALRQVRDRIMAIAPRTQASLCAVVGATTPAQQAEVRQILERELREGMISVADIQFTQSNLFPGEEEEG